MKKVVFIAMSIVIVFLALHVRVMSQQLATIRDIYNKVWDKANARLMTTPWAGAQQPIETETTILNHVWDKPNNMLRTSAGGGGGGDFSSNTAVSVDGEAVLFSSTTGKIGRRATGTGVAQLTSGVLTAANLSGDVTTSGGLVTTAVKVNGVTYPASPSTNSIPLVTAANTALYKVIPDCDVAAGFLNYDTGTQAFTCGAFVPGSGDVSAVGSCATGECFTGASPAASLTFNNATSGTVALQTVSGALGAVTVSLPAATDTLVGKATVDTLTNKTVDVESAGNVFTSKHKIWMPAASCVDGTAGFMWDVMTGQALTVACITGESVSKGVVNYPDSAFSYLQVTLMLPDDWVGVIEGRLVWQSAATSGAVVWDMQIGCVADDEVDDNVFNAAVQVTDVTKGTAQRVNFASLGTLTATNCAAGEMLHVALGRDGANVGDTLAGSAGLVGLELTIRRAQ